MVNIDVRTLNILINNKKELNDFESTIGEGVFDRKYRRFVKHITDYYRKFKSPPTLDTLIETSGALTNNNLNTYLNEIWVEVNSIDRVDHREYGYLISKVNERYKSEILQVVKDQLAEADLADVNVVNEASKNLAQIVNEIKNVGAKKIYKEICIKDNVSDWVDRFRYKQANPESAQGIMTGFSMLDYYTNGLRTGEFWLYAANTGQGKTAFLVNLAVNCWLGKNTVPTREQMANLPPDYFQGGVDVLFISAETKAVDIEDRFMSCNTGVDGLDLNKGKITKADGVKLATFLNFREVYPYRFKIIEVPRGITMGDVQRIYDEQKLSWDPKLIVIDYIQLLKDGGDELADWENLLRVAEAAHEFGKSNDVLVVSAAQLTEDDDIKKRKIGRSRGIKHNVDGMLEHQMREDEEMRSDAIIKCTKFRRGPVFTMNNLRKELNCSRFIDVGFNPKKGSTTNNVAVEEDLTTLIDEILNVSEES